MTKSNWHLASVLTSLESRAKVVNGRSSEGEPSDKVCESMDAAANLKSDEHFASISPCQEIIKY